MSDEDLDCPELERTHALADGELSAAEADAARSHLATCRICQAELADVMQMEALPVAAVAARPAAKPAEVVSLAWYRSKKLQVVATAVALAAGVILYVATRRHGPATEQPAPVQVALAPTRAIESRLAWSGAADYRPYDVPRSAAEPREDVPLAARADLERAGDSHGVGALALLAGDKAQAETFLGRANGSPDVLADRAALALANHDPERALGLADAALAAAPDHPAALWNRALALRDLQLGATAAAAFRAIAAHHEPGWAAEADKRATALDAGVKAERELTERVVAARAQLVATGAGLSLDDARALPGWSRLALYDALRAAPTADRIAALRPLADAIDGGAAALARTKPLGALAETYANIVAGVRPTGAARTGYLAQLRAAHADDLLLGALIQLSPDGRVVAPDDLAEFARLAAASPDPWMTALGLEQQARVALAKDDLPAAEALLLRERATCPTGTPGFRCIRAGLILGEIYMTWQRLPEARAVFASTWQLAHAQRDWYAELDLLANLARIDIVGDDIAGSGVSLVRAYAAEAGARSAGCADLADAHYLAAMALIDHLQPDAARKELAGVTDCAEVAPAHRATHLFVRAQLARTRATDGDIAALRAEIAALRDAKDTPATTRVVLDHAEGQLLIDRDPKAAEALLRRAIKAGRAAPAAETDAHRIIGFSYAVLALAAAKRGDGDGVLAWLAEEQGVAAPAACVLGLAADDEREVAVARDRGGVAHVAYDENRTAASAPSAIVTPALATALDGCPVVDVLARAPFHGAARLLPESIAWRFLTARPHPAGAPGDKDIVVADAEPPAALGLPRLAAWSGEPADLAGAAATPANVLSAIGRARVAVIDAHGVVDVGGADGSYLALSPDAAGRYELTAQAVRAASFPAAPVVILAACEASSGAPTMHQVWSLPAAFVAAGARAVIASAAPIPDADAGAFVAAVRARLRDAPGADVAVAIRDARQQWLAAGRGEWVKDIVVFE